MGQFRQAAINQTIGQIQADEQLRFAINQFITQTESSFLGALLPAIIQAEQINALTPQVGAPLSAGQSVTYSGTNSVTTMSGGATIVTQTTTTVTVTVGPDGVGLTGPATAHVVTTLADTGTVVSDETSSAGVMNGQLQAPNSTANSGTFVFIFPTLGTVTTPFNAFLGTSLFTGQFSNQMVGVNAPFTLTAQ